LDLIAHGQLQYKEVIHDLNKNLENEINAFLNLEISSKFLNECPSCSKIRLAKRTSAISKTNFWVCLNSSCDAMFMDVDGKPVKSDGGEAKSSTTNQVCPSCNKMHLRLTEYKPDKQQRFWFCPDKKQCSFFCASTQESAASDDPKPDLTKFNNNKTNGAKKYDGQKINDKLICPNCRVGELRKAKNKPLFFCTHNSKGCKTFIPEKDGKPDFDAQNSNNLSKTHKCPNCDGTLKLNRQQNKFYCSNYYQNCKTTVSSFEGEPDYRDLKSKQNKPFI
jgi:uncharacterized protein YbaR (Trm112 family)